MAQTNTREVPNMADGVVMDETEIRFKVMPKAYLELEIDLSAGNASVADLDNIKVKEKIYVESRLKARDTVDNADVENRNTPYKQLNTTNYSNLTAGEITTLLGLLKKIHDQDRASLNLVPA